MSKKVYWYKINAFKDDFKHKLWLGYDFNISYHGDLARFKGLKIATIVTKETLALDSTYPT